MAVVSAVASVRLSLPKVYAKPKFQTFNGKPKIMKKQNFCLGIGFVFFVSKLLFAKISNARERQRTERNVVSHAVFALHANALCIRLCFFTFSFGNEKTSKRETCCLANGRSVCNKKTHATEFCTLLLRVS